MKKNNLLIILLTACLILVTGCGGKQEEKKDVFAGKTVVTLGYLPITHTLPVFEMKELFEHEDKDIVVSLQKFSTWPDLMDALNTGKIDGASVLIELAMSARNKGIDLKAIGLGHKDGNAIVVSNEIQSVEDLKGRRFAIPSTQSSHNILMQDMLENAGMTVEDLSIVQLAPTEMPFSLASGAIDGYCVAEPFGAQIVSKDLGHVLYSCEDLWPDSICCAFVLRNDFIEENPEITKEISDMYFRAGDALDEKEAFDIAVKYLGQEKKTLDESLQWIHYNDLTITPDTYEVLCEKVIDYGVNEAPPSYDSFVYRP